MASSSLWITRRDAAELLGVSVRTIADLKHELPAAAVTGEGRAIRLHAPVVVKAWLAKQLPTAPRNDTEERQRRVKLALSERELAEVENKLVRRRAVLEALMPSLSIMRAAGDRLIRQFGNDAGEMFNEAVTDFEQAAGDALRRFEDRK